MKYALAVILAFSTIAMAQQADVKPLDAKQADIVGKYLAKREQVNAIKASSGIGKLEAQLQEARQQHPELAKAEQEMLALASEFNKSVPDGLTFDFSKMGLVAKQAPTTK